MSFGLRDSFDSPLIEPALRNLSVRNVDVFV